MSKASISAVIKAKNETRNIADCIASLGGFADEIIVVNDCSEDDTASIAPNLGTRVVDAESIDGMINALDKIGFEHVTGDWILPLDADERMTPTLAQKPLEAVTSEAYVGVRFARKSTMFDDWARYGGWFMNDQLRFFRVDTWDRSWDCGELHSQLPPRRANHGRTRRQ